MSLDHVKEQMTDMLGELESLNATIKFDCKEDGIIFLDATQGQAQLSDDDDVADCTIRISTKNLEKLIAGKLDPMLAYTMGKLKVKGSMGTALKLTNLLNQAVVIVRKTGILLGALCAFLVSQVAWAATTLEYTILKEGEPIGKEVVAINDTDKGYNVDVVTQTNVKMLFLEFNYEHQRHEVWENGELVAMQSRTNDDGTHHEYNVTRTADGLQVMYDGKRKTFDLKSLPLSLWSKAALNRPVLFSVIDAEPYKIETKALGEDHFKIDGEITRELWFADDGYLEKAAFKRKGFLIEFVRKQVQVKGAGTLFPTLFSEALNCFKHMRTPAFKTGKGSSRVIVLLGGKMPKLSKCHFMATFAATAALLAGMQQVHAAGFQLKEQSAEGQGNSFAGSTAKAYDASTIFFNPAGMSRLEGNQFQANASLIMPSAEYEHESSSRAGGTLFNDTNDNGGVTAVVPSLYGVYEVNDKMKVGVSINTPFGLSTDYKDDWVGAQYNLLSKIETITTTPSLSYQINPQLSFGVGLQIQYLGGELTRKASPVVGGDVELQADDMGVGATFGMLYQYSEGGRVGVNYRSQVNHTLDGHVKISNSTGGAADTYYRAQADLTTPDIISIGWYHELDDKWAVMSDIAWTNWSVFKELRVEDKAGVRADSVTTYEWEDTMFYSLGVNYQYNDQLKLQTGVAYDEGAANDEHRTAGIPDSDRYWLSVGAEYKVSDSIKWNIGYSHLWGDDAKVTEDSRAATGSGYAGTFENHVDIVTVGMNISFQVKLSPPVYKLVETFFTS